MRIALGVEYDGTDFCGWQRQLGTRTVQGCVEEALSKVANHPVQVVCAGRTDTGVHATGQVVHFDSAADRTMHSWLMGSNASLPKDVSLCWAQPVTEDFHARFRAEARRYRYIILNRPVRSGLYRNRVCWEHNALDATTMQEAAKLLEGEHDFSSFRTAACQANHPVRTIHGLNVQRDGEFIVVDVEANAFLHHMVRNIAGVLMAVGRGQQPVAWVQEVLDAKDRTVAGVTAQSAGLYLVQVKYPTHFDLPVEPRVPGFS